MKGIILNNGYCLNNIQTLSSQEDTPIEAVTLTVEPKTTKQVISSNQNQVINKVVVNPIENQNMDTQTAILVDSADEFYDVDGVSCGYYEEKPIIKIPKEQVIQTLGIDSNKIVKGDNIGDVYGDQLVLQEETFTDVIASNDIKQFTDVNGNVWNCRYLELEFSGQPFGVTGYTNNYDQIECISYDTTGIVSMKVEPNGIPIITHWTPNQGGVELNETKIIIPLLINSEIKCKYSGKIWGSRT